MNAELDANEFDQNLRAVHAHRLVDGLDFQWLQAGQIAYYHVTEASEAAVDAWLENTLSILDGWSPQRPYLHLLHIEHLPFHLTTYAVPHIKKMGAAAPLVDGRVAVLLQGNFINRVVGALLNLSKSGHRAKRIFHDYDDTIAWLTDALD